MWQKEASEGLLEHVQYLQHCADQGMAQASIIRLKYESVAYRSI
jgi:hypothetical protein